jgi:CheY-like chemotaxis protein
MQRLRQLFHRSPHFNCFAMRLILCSLCVLLWSALPAAPSAAQAETPTPAVAATPSPGPSGAAATAADQPSDLSPAMLVLMILIMAVILGVPLGYFYFRKPAARGRAILLVSTDEATRKLLIGAARKAGFRTEHVYRYEDALEKLRQNFLLRMVVIDDSVPQYEVGLLASALQRMPAGSRPLILIQDSSELGQTAYSHRAEMLISRPLTEKTLENAIREVGERTTPLF